MDDNLDTDCPWDLPCDGEGWVQIGDDHWEECPIHYVGQLHPQSKLLMLDEPKLLQEEDERSRLRWQIKRNQDRVTVLAKQLQEEQDALLKAELELVNRTPTIRMAAIRPSIPIIIMDNKNTAEL